MVREEQMNGGNVNTVVRIADTVRRPFGSWSESVHQLLLHLQRQGFENAPRFLGIDEQGREILSFLESEVGFAPYLWSEQPLVAAAELLRRFHDATTSFAPPPGTHRRGRLKRQHQSLNKH